MLAVLLGAGCGPNEPIAPDAGDAGPRDDAGPSDAGPSDAGPSDAGPDDAGPIDTGPIDAGAPMPALTPHLPRAGVPAPDYASCIFASPLRVESRGASLILVIPEHGDVIGLDPESGAEVFTVALPVPAGQTPQTLATPVVADGRVYVAYQTFVPPDGDRATHRVVAVDLATRSLDPAFETLELAVSVPDFDGDASVDFRPDRALSRSTLAFGRTTARPEGLVYVAFGNARDIQPWHGWVFELDVRAWRTGAAADAHTATMLTTPESECAPEGTSGARDMSCGGGVWSPAGPLVIQRADDFELIVPTGNGQLDLRRDDFANTLVRSGAGLEIDTGCDPTLCAGFDPIAPSDACVASCRDLFVPRIPMGDPPLAPETGVCDGLTFFECYAALDYDLGASSPAQVTSGGRELFVLPAKDGAVYLVDGVQMGILHDRVVVSDQCGTPTDPCRADWAGMMVTEPVSALVDGEPRVAVSTFVFDRTHTAGVVGLAIVEGPDGPRLEERWRAPERDHPEARERFRQHPSRLAMTVLDGETYVFVVDVALAGGTMLMIRMRDGQIVDRAPLVDPGRRFIEPLIFGDRIYTTSCRGNEGPGRLLAFDIVH